MRKTLGASHDGRFNTVCKVSNINYKTGCMEVTYEDREDSVTDMIPMLANAGYKMPKVGDTVVVAHNSNGEEEGVGFGHHLGRK